jgi:hypothetical protein
MAAMAILRRSGALLFAALLVCLAATPLAAQRCTSRRACPMMAKMGSPCHAPGAGSMPGMATPMSCCEPKATTTPAPSASALAPGLVALPTAGVPALAADEISTAASWRANRHDVGLFTLHAVWRI